MKIRSLMVFCSARCEARKRMASRMKNEILSFRKFRHRSQLFGASPLTRQIISCSRHWVGQERRGKKMGKEKDVPFFHEKIFHALDISYRSIKHK
ncbi:hypothetical protein CEXT_376371 [Caerostris extrusa]|uniref:Uncharacterized protein n=1 Tax=Caerostris extrusa TaxID=172846 RepID=A0AAV4NJK5_CAEEX|nr:hypothetical protein CEXT_376371 [Caerostris extrusa]